MVPLLLGLPGVTCFLCQDPVELYFGKERSGGGRSTVKQFCDNTVSLRMQGSAALEPIRGNCTKRKHSSLSTVDYTALPKRPRYSRDVNKKYVHA